MLRYQHSYNANVIAEGLSHNTEASTYLDREFQEFITASLEELLRKRPQNPIFFLANRLKEKQKEANARKLEQEKKAAEEARTRHRSRGRHTISTVGTTENLSIRSTSGESSASTEEVEKKNPTKRNELQHTQDGYQLRISEGCECQIQSVSSQPPQYIPGVPVAEVLFPSMYDLDSILRVMEATATPSTKTGKATPLVFVVEEVSAPQRTAFIKGIPYIINLVNTPQSSEQSSEFLTTPHSRELLLRTGIEVLKGSLCDDVMFLEDAIRNLVSEKQAEGSDIRLCILPSVQANYLKRFDQIDEVFFQIMHPELMESIFMGTHYSKVLSARDLRYEEPPSVLFASFNPQTANLTFSRVIQSYFPYYERRQNMKMDELRELNLAKKKQLSIQFCENYWADVHRRRDERDKRHKLGAGKQARIARREREDARFLEVLKSHKNFYATEIQRVFRGYMVRKRFVVPKSASPLSTRYDTRLPLSVPPLLRMCASRISAVHGELFGNYPRSFLPQPKRLVFFKPVRRPIKESEEDSEEEEWVEEAVLIPPKRFSQEPYHFNPLQRLMEYQRIAQCTHLESAIGIQRQCTGLSFLQRKAYDHLKSVALNLLHIAFLELFHRDRLSLETMQFSSFVRNFHGEVCGWFAYPHLCSQSSLLSACSEQKDVVHHEEDALRAITEDFIRAAMRKERLLMLCSERDYFNPSNEKSKDELCLRRIAANVFVISRILSLPEWKAALQVIFGDTVSVSVSKNAKKELCWWFLSDSPCISVYGRVFSFRPRKNDELVEGMERFDEFSPREILVSENSPFLCTHSACIGESKNGSSIVFDNTLKKVQPMAENVLQEDEAANGEDFLSISTICEKYTVQDAENYLRQMILNEILVNGHLDFYKKGIRTPSLEKRRLHRLELEAERFQEQRNRQIDAKHRRNLIERKYPESEHDSINATGEMSKCFTEADYSVLELQSNETLTPDSYPISSESSVSSSCHSPLQKNYSILTIQETVNEIEGSEEGVRINLIRPRLNFSPQEEFIYRFDSFIESCLSQLRKEKVIVLNFGASDHLFYYAALTVLSQGYELANVVSSFGGTETTSLGPLFQPPSEIDESFQETHNSALLSFLNNMHDILREAMAQNGVDVNGCIRTLHNTILQELECYNLLRLMVAEVEKAEKATDSKMCRKHILSSVRYAEHYTWLVLLQVYLSLPFTKQSLSSYAVNSTPSFMSFYRNLKVRQWIETIDPWINRPEQSPDVFHCRYTNSLRRWDVDDYICYGALADPKME